MYNAYTDGSYIRRNGNSVTTFAVEIYNDEDILVARILRYIDHPGYLNMRNVGGEILGASAAIDYAVKNKIPHIKINYDYLGIECWATHKWKTNNEYTKEYVDFIDNARNTVNIEFNKIKSHSGNKKNDSVDIYARELAEVYMSSPDSVDEWIDRMQIPF